MNCKALAIGLTLMTAGMAIGADPTPPKPISSVVITQCNLLVVAYITTADGRLVRYTKASGLSYFEVIKLAQSAIHTEVADIPCDAPSLTI